MKFVQIERMKGLLPWLILLISATSLSQSSTATTNDAASHASLPARIVTDIADSICSNLADETSLYQKFCKADGFDMCSELTYCVRAAWPATYNHSL